MFKGRENGNGFHITFPNGWTASVQWNENNYCSRKEYNGYGPSDSAELWAWNGEKRYPDNPLGYQNAVQTMAFLNEVSRMSETNG